MNKDESPTTIINIQLPGESFLDDIRDMDLQRLNESRNIANKRGAFGVGISGSCKTEAEHKGFKYWLKRLNKFFSFIFR